MDNVTTTNQFRIVLSLPGVFDPDTGLEFYSATIHADSPDSFVIKDCIRRLDATQAPGGVQVVRLERKVTWVSRDTYEKWVTV